MGRLSLGPIQLIVPWPAYHSPDPVAHSDKPFMMIIDSHQHFWKYNSVAHGWISDDMRMLRRDFMPDELKEIASKCNVGGTVAVQADQTEAETEFLLALAEEYPLIKGVVGWVDLKASNLEDRLGAYQHRKLLKGFRHIVQAEPTGFLTDPVFIKGVNTLARFGYTYDLLIYHHQLPEALAFAAQTREVKMVLDHIGKPSIKTGEKTHWELNLAALATFENIHCKLSGMITEADWTRWRAEDIEPFMDEVFECFGADRVMYGSDWPVCLVAGSYEQQFFLIEQYISKLSPDEKAKVLGDNAKRFYNL